MVRIQAAEKWNETSYQISAGKKYRFISPEEPKWFDKGIPATATGFKKWYLWPFAFLKRYPKGKWFSLIGAIDKDKQTLFDIGSLIEKGATYTATKSGTLFCFANDVEFMYGNNTGEIELEVVNDL